MVIQKLLNGAEKSGGFRCLNLSSICYVTRGRVASIILFSFFFKKILFISF